MVRSDSPLESSPERSLSTRTVAAVTSLCSFAAGMGITYALSRQADQVPEELISTPPLEHSLTDDEFAAYQYPYSELEVRHKIHSTIDVQELPELPDEVQEMVTKSVVQVEAVVDGELRYGSGVLVENSEDELIVLTAGHNVDRADEDRVSVVTGTGNSFPAEVIYADYSSIGENFHEDDFAVFRPFTPLYGIKSESEL